MFSLFKEEFLFFVEKKKKYYFQTIINYLERIIFFVGMILLLASQENIIEFEFILKAIFWFILVNSFLEMSQRIESEIRLKQFNHCFHLRTSYWTILFMRMIPVFLDSLLIALSSVLIVCCFVHIDFDISITNAFLYMILMTFQYVIFQYIFSFVAIYFQRIQAVMGIIESYTFFYSGIVLISPKYSMFIFTTMNHIINGAYHKILNLLLLMVVEIIVVICGTHFITRHVKK